MAHAPRAQSRALDLPHTVIRRLAARSEEQDGRAIAPDVTPHKSDAMADYYAKKRERAVPRAKVVALINEMEAGKAATKTRSERLVDPRREVILQRKIGKLRTEVGRLDRETIESTSIL
jgi:hypothetical protein